MIKVTIEGSEGTDSERNPVCILLDVCGFLGDYPALLQTIDVMRHRAGAP